MLKERGYDPQWANNNRIYYDSTYSLVRKGMVDEKYLLKVFEDEGEIANTFRIDDSEYIIYKDNYRWYYKTLLETTIKKGGWKNIQSGINRETSEDVTLKFLKRLSPEEKIEMLNKRIDGDYKKVSKKFSNLKNSLKSESIIIFFSDLSDNEKVCVEDFGCFFGWTVETKIINRNSEKSLEIGDDGEELIVSDVFLDKNNLEDFLAKQVQIQFFEIDGDKYVFDVEDVADEDK